METVKKIISILFVALILIVVIKVAPIYYRAYSLSGICKENADLYHKYRNQGGRSYVFQKIDEELSSVGIPREKRGHNVTVTNEGVFVDIYYEDTADFFGQYYKDYEFEVDCEGVLYSPTG